MFFCVNSRSVAYNCIIKYKHMNRMMNNIGPLEYKEKLKGRGGGAVLIRATHNQIKNFYKKLILNMFYMYPREK